MVESAKCFQLKRAVYFVTLMLVHTSEDHVDVGSASQTVYIHSVPNAMKMFVCIIIIINKLKWGDQSNPPMTWLFIALELSKWSLSYLHSLY